MEVKTPKGHIIKIKGTDAGINVFWYNDLAVGSLHHSDCVLSKIDMQLQSCDRVIESLKAWEIK